MTGDRELPTEPAPPSVDVREQLRRQMLDGLGGWSGMLISAAPTVVFVLVNAVAGLRDAVIAAVLGALLLTGYRLVRHQSMQQSLNGLFGVLIAAVIAARTGQARGYFLVGIWSSFAYSAVFLVSLIVRRPLIGLVWEFLDPTPAAEGAGGADGAGGMAPAWFRRPALLRAYTAATIAATTVFAARAAVQLALFRHDSTGWLAVTRIAMGYPLTVAALGFAFLMVRRARRALRAGG